MKSLKRFALAALLACTAGMARSAGPDIYPEPAQARADLAAALKTRQQRTAAFCSISAATGAATASVLDLYFHDARKTSRFSTRTSLSFTSISAAWTPISTLPSSIGVPAQQAAFPPWPS
jgi:hypothetical protein